MKPRRLLQLTELDVTRLEKHAERDSRLQATLDTLLERAEIVGPEAMKSNVITMNSQFTLTNDTTNEAITWTLVYPDQASLDSGKLNVFSPVGLALLGARKGERVAVTLPNTSAGAVTVSAIVYQPEASGDYTR
ncbi:GreA/GreB family elongation factor [Burkholderia sp. Ac-20379]|uniref:GreA/GreB family elongation factor n=1 Tax=Burkholderia sp. Ac-20379 TaxID=2703900 RepID=UPI00197DB3C0|nr:GreA/GreB family elongation factor [Burkholderia sp. Ac-20379]MBN3726966.1 transcription elongation factor GreAB [Burkholderia sp. Ac-20379]